MEIEIKYENGGYCAETLLKNDMIAAFITKKPCINMLAIYYDTKNGDLARSALALRLRRENNEYVCALKGGRIENGIARRIEIEVSATSISSGWLKICQTPDFSDIMSLLPKNSPLLCSAPAFIETARIEFLRNVWDFSRNDLQCELAQDFGFIRAGQHDAIIDEFEIELKHGDESSFLNYISALESSTNIVRATKSKYSRALDLINSNNA